MTIIVLNILLFFDCGTSWGVRSRSRKLVEHTFDKDETIDYLFISHLDKDHISLVESMLTSVKCVREIVLPLVSEEDLVLSLALYQTTGTGEASSADFIVRLLSHLRGVGNDDYTIRFVGSHEPQDTWWRSVKCGNGETLSFPDSLEWVYIPYNVESESRKESLKDKLGQLLTDGEIIGEIDSLGDKITNSDEFFGKLKEEGFVEKVIRANGALLKGLKRVYDKLDGTINDNSLQLYSGPATTEHRFESVCPFYLIKRLPPISSGCLPIYWRLPI
jgi:hypothetical protein